MKNFEEELSKLLASKRRTRKKAWEPNPKDSLEMLLKYVYQQVMVPVQLALTEQQNFFSSTLELDSHFGADDAVGDGLKDRPMAKLSVFRRSKPVFEYWLSFDGDNKNSDAALWRKIDFASTFPKFDIDNPPPNLFDGFDNDKPFFEFLTKKQKSAEEYVSFATFDMEKAVLLVQQDLYSVCKALL